MRIEASSPTGLPGGSLGSLWLSESGGTVTGTTAGIDLDPNTTYLVVFESTDSNSANKYERTNSDNEDAAKAAGWSIGNTSLFTFGGSWSASSRSSTSWKISIRGAPKSDTTGPAVTIAAGTSPVTEGTDATFTLTIAEAPTTDVTVNLTVYEADGSDYVAAADEGPKMATISMGETSANYSVTTQGDSKDEPNGSVTVRVDPGTGYSVGTTSSASVTVNDDDTNNVATGAPAITGFPQVGQTLTAGTSGIADTDGLTSVSYSYQWIRTDSGTDTDIASATNSTYVLTQADSAKTVKVKVTFHRRHRPRRDAD